eukprot:2081434-Alexandrium_andersonii.AAC.1
MLSLGSSRMVRGLRSGVSRGDPHRCSLDGALGTLLAFSDKPSGSGIIALQISRDLRRCSWICLALV